MACFSVVIFAFIFLMVHGESVRRVGDEKPTNFLIWGTTEISTVENATDALTVDVTYSDGTQSMTLTTTATSYDRTQTDTNPNESNTVDQPWNHEDANASVMDEVTIISTKENQLNTISTNTSSDSEINPDKGDYENETNVTSTDASSDGAEQFIINPQTINDNEQIERTSNETSISEATTISNGEINNQTNENPEHLENTTSQIFHVSLNSEINPDGEDYKNQTNVVSTNSSSADGDNSTTSETISDSYEDLQNNTMGSLSWNASTQQVNNVSNTSAHEDSANIRNQTNGKEAKDSPVAKDSVNYMEEFGENTNEKQPISKLDHDKLASDLVISGQTPTTTVDLVKENNQTQNCEDVNKTCSLSNGATTAGGSANNQNQTNGTGAVASPAIEKSVNQNTEEEERMDDVQGPTKINISTIDQVFATTTSTFQEVNRTENYGDGQLITREVHFEDVEKVSNFSAVTGATIDENSANNGNQANGTGAEDNLVTDHPTNQNEESGEYGKNIKKEDATSNSGPVPTKTSDTLKEIGQTENSKTDFDEVNKISNTSLVNGTTTDEGSENDRNQTNGTGDEESVMTADQTNQNQESTELGKRTGDEKLNSKRDESLIGGVSANTTNTVKEVNHTENYGDGQLKATEAHLEYEEAENTTANGNANAVGNKLVNETMGSKTSFENITEKSVSLSNETNKVGGHTTVLSGNYEGATDDTTKNQFSEGTTASPLESVENSGRSTTSTSEPSNDTSVISSHTPATTITAAIDELPSEDEYTGEEEIEEQTDEENYETATTDSISLNELISVFEKLHSGKIEELNVSTETAEYLDAEISSMEDENGSTSTDNITTSEFTSKSQQ